MQARELAEEFPVVAADSNALDAVRLMADRRLPGLVVTDADGRPKTILAASEAVQMLLPSYVKDDPSLAGVLSESMADHICDAIGDKTVASVLPKPLPDMPSVRHDDNIVEVAAAMARHHAPLVAVVSENRVIGVITASRLLEVALSSR